MGNLTQILATSPSDFTANFDPEFAKFCHSWQSPILTQDLLSFAILASLPVEK